MELEKAEGVQEMDEVEAEIQMLVKNSKKRIVVPKNMQTEEAVDSLGVEAQKAMIRETLNVSRAINMATILGIIA